MWTSFSPPAELVALGAPFLVALSNIAAGPFAARLGAAGFNLLRLCTAVAGMGLLVLGLGVSRTLSAGEAGALVLSALVGLVLGDTATYAALARIGARRTSLLYATNGAMAAALGYVLYGETITPSRLGGIVFAFIDESETDVLAHMDFPAQHRTKIHSTNPIERLNKEVKRRADVVGIFPNEGSIIRLIGAVLLEANDEWQTQHRYMQTEAMAELTPPTIDAMPSQITTVAA